MPGFVKTHANAAVAQEALRRSHVLRKQGVQTPAATAGTVPNEILFDRIEGKTGTELIAGAALPLLRAVTVLHQAQVQGLPGYDPFLRIRPRIGLTEVALLHDILSEPVPTGTATLHGDLHVGQFIRDQSGSVWIIDLDDLAVGPPEADLANFAAHLATTLPGEGIAGWSAQVRQTWTGMDQPLDPRVFGQYLRFALLRRHLKLRAARRPDFEVDILSYLRASASFSIL